MGRMSNKVKGYTKGKTEKGYWGTRELKHILLDIHCDHKSWGNEWYEKVLLKNFDGAKVLLAIKGKGECRNKALDIIDELIERGED